MQASESTDKAILRFEESETTKRIGRWYHHDVGKGTISKN